MNLPNLSKTWIFKFEKMSISDVEKLMLATSAFFEFYIPYEKSNFKYVIAAVFSENEAKNIKNYLEGNDKEMIPATPQELADAESLLGFEYCYLRNVMRVQK